MGLNSVRRRSIWSAKKVTEKEKLKERGSQRAIDPSSLKVGLTVSVPVIKSQTHPLYKNIFV